MYTAISILLNPDDNIIVYVSELTRYNLEIFFRALYYRKIGSEIKINLPL